MKIKTVKIKEVDLEKLIKKAKIKSAYQLALMSGVDYAYLSRANKGIVNLSYGAWTRIKAVLDGKIS